MSPLAELLRAKLLPWSRQNAGERFIVARSAMRPAELPPGVQLVQRELPGERVVVKNLRLYDNTRGVAALWPEAGLNEVNKIKLACVLSGHIDYQLGKYSLRCGPGHFLFIAPGVPHPDGSRSYVDTEKSTACAILFFLLHPNAIECWISHYDEPGRRQASKYLVLHERATLLLRALAEEVIAGEENSIAIGAELLPGFFLLVQREAEAGRLQLIRSNSPQWPPATDITHAASDNFTTRLERYVQANLHKPLTLEKVSRDMYLSRTQFIRAMRRETGKSFNEFLSYHRVEEAKILLRDAPWTVSAIAYFVGFKSPSYFRTFFRAHTGQTPTEFRRALLSDNP